MLLFFIHWLKPKVIPSTLNVLSEYDPVTPELAVFITMLFSAAQEVAVANIATINNVKIFLITKIV